MTDPLGEIMRRVRLTGCVYFQRDFMAPWSMRMADTGFAQFHAVTSGNCVLEAEGCQHEVGTGDLLLFPHGCAHVLSDRAGRRPVEGARFMAALSAGAPMFTEGHAPTRLICGHFAYRQDMAHPLLAELPPVVHLSAAQLATSPAVPSLLSLIIGELSRGRPGHTLSVEKLAEVLLVQILRVHHGGLTRPHGFFAGLVDPRLGRAISRIHADYGGSLTLADLAETAAMSRSTFAQRFSDVVGMSPIDYLQRWRMLVARDMLTSTDRPVAEIAETVGYGSDIAFMRSYKRRFGVTPAAARRA